MRKNNTSREARERWKAENYSRINIYLPKADAENYKKICLEQGKKLSDIPKEAIYKFMGA